ncbi:MAG: acyl carrier protein [Cellvibrionaceae bacterium]
MADAIEKVRDYISQNLGIDLNKVSNDDPLFSSGVIDSFALIELLAFLENDLGVEIDIADIDIDQLDTIDGLAKMADAG